MKEQTKQKNETKLETEIIKVERVKRQPVNELPASFIVEKLKQIFTKAVGRENAVTMPEIYNYCYEGNGSDNKYVKLIQCQRIVGFINLLKNKTHFFIIGEYDQENYYLWYVVKTQAEADAYKNMIDSKIAGLKMMKEKVDIAVKEKWYQSLEYQPRKMLKGKYDTE